MPPPDICSAVTRHYDRFPYPDPRRLVYPAAPRGTRRVMEWALGRSLADGPADIWVAGCGTVRAAEIALCHPDARIVATDISAVTLQIARGIAKTVGVGSRIDFRQHDLGAGPLTDRPFDFDLIDCLGVLHHVADPQVGMRTLADALKPDGVVDLLVYQHAHRAGIERLRHATRLLAHPNDADLELVGEIVESLADSTVVSDATREIARAMADLARHEPAACADALLHPFDRTYGPDTLVALAESGGLAFSGFVYPTEWTADAWSLGPVIARRLAALPEIEAAAALTLLLGDTPPYLEIYLRRSTSAPAAPIVDAQLLAGSVRPHGPWRFYTLRDAAVAELGVWVPFPEEDGSIHVKGRVRDMRVEPRAVELLQSIGEGGDTDALLQRWSEKQRQSVDIARPGFLRDVRALLCPSVPLLVFDADASG